MGVWIDDSTALLAVECQSFLDNDIAQFSDVSAWNARMRFVAPDYESGGQEFESLRARQIVNEYMALRQNSDIMPRLSISCPFHVRFTTRRVPSAFRCDPEPGKPIIAARQRLDGPRARSFNIVGVGRDALSAQAASARCARRTSLHCRVALNRPVRLSYSLQAAGVSCLAGAIHRWRAPGRPHGPNLEMARRTFRFDMARYIDWFGLACTALALAAIAAVVLGLF